MTSTEKVSGFVHWGAGEWGSCVGMRYEINDLKGSWNNKDLSYTGDLYVVKPGKFLWDHGNITCDGWTFNGTGEPTLENILVAVFEYLQSISAHPSYVLGQDDLWAWPPTYEMFLHPHGVKNQS